MGARLLQPPQSRQQNGCGVSAPPPSLLQEEGMGARLLQPAPSLRAAAPWAAPPATTPLPTPKQGSVGEARQGLREHDDGGKIVRHQ